ncbi:MAG: L-serine ammonia-lyase, iron-sulfur-dependent, subunit alpha [Candidatus Enteromonas sp.]|nr:L-serine ammonia-lyase, iron-sulfur-dependent, subunit alpha [Candidatus Enteromonas sp.]
MKSLRHLFRIGPGPSSSHTIGPFRAAFAFKERIAGIPVSKIRVTFYGSLALTGIGHSSNSAIRSGLNGYEIEEVFDIKTTPPHPLTMDFEAFHQDQIVKKCRYFSLGGGEISSNDDPEVNEKDVYPFQTFEEIKALMQEKGYSSIKELCLAYEDPSIDEYLMSVLKEMLRCVENGLKKSGPIPSNSNPRLALCRSAKSVYEAAERMGHHEGKKEILMTAYAYAVAESNACGERIVTAPTCGSSGVLPSCLYYLHKQRHVPLVLLRDALYAAGIFGNVVKANASIAGSVGGCQAEIGTAASMAAAALSSAAGLTLYQIEYAAECAMEHFLGLSCDPVDGYVIIPCIERNGIGALRASASYLYARHISPIRKNQVRFDDVVTAMKLTGESLSSDIKETAEGGLARILRCN